MQASLQPQATTKKATYSIEWRRSIFLFQREAEKYNEGKKLGESLRDTHLHLFQLLLKEQIKSLREMQDSGILLQPGDELPNFYTNNPYLAKCMMGASERKIRYLIERLKTAGILDRYVFHGRKHDFELRINPQLLFLYENNEQNRRQHRLRLNMAHLFDGSNNSNTDENEAPQQAQELPVKEFYNPEKLELILELHSSGAWAQLPALQQSQYCAECGLNPSDLDAFASCPKWKTLPPKGYQLVIKLETNKLNKLDSRKSEDKTAARYQRETRAGNETQTRQPNGSEKLELKVPGGAAAEKMGPTAIPTHAPDTLAEAIVHLSKEQQREVARMVRVIYKQASKFLYAGVQIDPIQQEKGLARLSEYFCYHSPTKWKAQYTEMKRRIVLAHRWLKKSNIKRSKQGLSPFWVAMPATYFDIRHENKHFVATKAWYHEDKKARIEIARTRKLNAAIRAFEVAHQTGNRDEMVKVYQKHMAILTRIDQRIFQDFKDFVQTVTAE